MAAGAKAAVIISDSVKTLPTYVNKMIYAKVQSNAGKRADLVQLAISVNLAPVIRHTSRRRQPF